MEEEIIINESELSDKSLLKGINNAELLDSVKQYLKEIGDFQLLSNEENMDLLKKYHINQDMNAREKLIKHNLKLVVWYVKTHKKFTKSMEFIDLIQEGNIALIKAIDKFDISNYSTFSTYVIKSLGRIVNRAIDDKDKTVRMPEYLAQYYKKYIRYTSEYYKEHNSFPTKDEIIKNTEMAESIYNNIIDYINNMENARSLNEVIGDEEDTTLENFVPSKSNEFTNIENKIDFYYLLYRLKNNLTNQEYYLIYNYYLKNDKVNFIKLGDNLGVTRQFVQQTVEKIRNKIKNKDILNKKVNVSIKELYKSDLLPIDFKKKVILIYLKDKVDEELYLYLYYKWFRNLDDEKLQYKLRTINHDDDKISSYDDYIQFIDNMDDDNYSFILNEIKNKYTTNEIFELDIEPVKINYAFVNNLLYNLSYDEILNLLGEKYYNLTKKEQKLLSDWFDNDFTYIHKRLINSIEGTINLRHLGYTGNKKLDLTLLYKTYLNNKDKFDLEYQEYLEGTLFSKFTGKHLPINIAYKDRRYYTIKRLEEYYYKLDNYFRYMISKKDFEITLNKYAYFFKEDEFKYLHEYYCEDHNLTYEEFALKHGYSKKDMKAILNYGYDRIIELYLGMKNDFIIKEDDIYVKYINDPNYPMMDLHREILRLRYVEKRDYKYIKEKLNIDSTQKVSNYIGKSIYNIEMYHFNVSNERRYENNKILELLNTKKNLTDREKEIIKAHFIDNIEINELIKIYGINNKEIKTLFASFSASYLSYYAKKDLTKEEIEKEINCHETDSIINETQKKILSYLYGIKSIYNEDANYLEKNDIIKCLGIDEIQYKNALKEAKIRIGARINGLFGPELGRVSKDEVIDAINNPDIPLTNDEKNLLKQIKGIETETKSLDELATEFKINKSSVKRRVLNAYLTILKYQNNNTLTPVYNYHKDILPKLKFFPLYDQMILKDLFEHNLTQYDISLKYNINYNLTRNIIKRVKKRLFYILKCKNARVFDFDYARKIIDDPTLPYYGDINVAKKIYMRFFGDDGNLPNDDYNVDISSRTKTNDVIKELMLACLKYKDGYRKINEISKQEIIDFYNVNNSNYSPTDKKLFEAAIKRDYSKNKIQKCEINPFVLYEIVKEKHKNKILLIDNFSQREIINILKTNPYNLSNAKLEQIRNYLKIPKRNLISGKDKNKLYRLIYDNLYQKKKENNPQKKLII